MEDSSRFLRPCMPCTTDCVDAERLCGRALDGAGEGGWLLLRGPGGSRASVFGFWRAGSAAFGLESSRSLRLRDSTADRLRPRVVTGREGEDTVWAGDWGGSAMRPVGDETPDVLLPCSRLCLAPLGCFEGAALVGRATWGSASSSLLMPWSDSTTVSASDSFWTSASLLGSRACGERVAGAEGLSRAGDGDAGVGFGAGEVDAGCCALLGILGDGTGWLLPHRGLGDGAMDSVAR
jgi:hypothetical protein